METQLFSKAPNYGSIVGILLTLTLLCLLVFLSFSVVCGQTVEKSEKEKAKFIVKNCVARISNNATTVIETPATLRYVSPHFTAAATVECSTPEDEGYMVGFIQQVDFSSIRMDYDRAFTSWELPGLPLRDSSGAGLLWYHNGDGRKIIEPGEQNKLSEVSVNDNFDVRVTWQEPLPPVGKVKDSKPELQKISREQRFTLWLVVRRSSDGKMSVLKKISWGMKIEISVDPTSPLGSRATVRPVTVEQPIVVDAVDLAEGVSPEVLKSRRANEAQQLWWNPKIDGIGERSQLE